jgi:hypothetical protein
MKPMPIRLPERRRLPSLLAVVCVFAVSTAPVWAQSAVSEPAETPQEPPHAQVFRLQHAKAEQFQQLAQKLLGDEARIVAEPVNNVVLVTAPGELMPAVTQLVEALDVAKPEERETTFVEVRRDDVQSVADMLSRMVPDLQVTAEPQRGIFIMSGAPRALQQAHRLVEMLDQRRAAKKESGESEYRIIPLRHIPAQQMAQILAAAGASDEIRVAVEPLSNSLLVSGRRPESLTTLEAIVSRFDQARAQLQLRVVWLVSGMEKTQPVPQDLGPVVGELEKIGLKDLGLACQMSVRSVSDEQLQIQSPVSLDQTPMLLSLDGMARLEGSNVQLMLKVQVKSTFPPDAPNTLSVIQTTIRTPLEHYVVLGVTPGGTYPSAFIVQVTEPK